MKQVAVVVVRDKVVDALWLFDSVVKATVKFFDECASSLSNWEDYTVEDRDAVIMDGYAEFGKGSVCIVWPFSKDD